MPRLAFFIFTFLATAFFALSVPVMTLAQGSVPDKGIRIDVPANGQVRVENSFGDVKAEVWQEQYVLVSASFEEPQAFKRPPVLIENRNQVLLISVSLTPVDPKVAVHLAIKVPRSLQIEMVTRAGSILLSGLPATASLRSDSGNIRAELDAPKDVDLSVRTGSGIVRSELDAPLLEGGKVLRSRLGSGESVLRVNTISGQVDIGISKQQTSEGAASVSNGPPLLVGNETSGTGAGTPARDVPNEEVAEGDIIRVDSQLVTLNVSVIDRNNNRGVPGLNQNDFRLFEDGTEQDILRFDSASAPFDLILLIDLSGSTREVVKLIRQAALHFVAAARPSDRIGIITFAGAPTLISPLTLDRDSLRRSIENIDTTSGDTKLYDATAFALQRFAGDNRTSRRTAIVLMSDGLDGTVAGVSGQQGSRLPYSELLSQVQEFEGVLYTIWLNTYYEALNPKDTQPEAFELGHDRLKEMSEAGGGIFYEVDRLEDLAGAYSRVVADLGTVYSLAYRPSNKARDGKWRAIKVNLSRPTAVARGKHGYYAN
jgi:VWFA-related protein